MSGEIASPASSIHSRSESRSSPQIQTSSPSPDYIEVHLPTTSTRRPPANTQHSIRSPAPIPTPAPDYDTIGPPNIILTNQPPAISEDQSPPWYNWGDDSNTSIVPPLFLAIFSDDAAELTRLLAEDPSLVNTRDNANRTPLYCATIAYQHSIDIVKLLLEAGAPVNEWSTERCNRGNRSNDGDDVTERTALMAACTNNRLPVARLLLSAPYNADASLVAPDGQHALRLASAAGAREIVELLPSVRAGGWARIKYRSRPQVRRIKKAGKAMYKVGKVLVWHIPKFLIWTCPKEIAKCLWALLKSICKDTWNGIKATGRGLAKLPKATYDFAMWLPGATARGVAKVPGALKQFIGGVWKVVKDFVRWTWKFATVTAPHAIASVARFFRELTVALAKWAWKFITVHLPKVSVMLYTAVIAGLKKSCEWGVNVVTAVASLLHTCVSFLLRKCTWSNVVAGVKTMVGFIFVDVPVSLWNGAKATYHVMFKLVEGLFGCIGWLFWKLGECLVAAAMWFPAMMGVILLSVGKIFGHVWKEIRVWVNPKAEV